MELTIYADILFGFNFLMNLLILFLTTQLSRVPIRPVRLSIVSFLLSIYAVVCFVPKYSFFSSVWIKLFSSIISIYMLIYPSKLQLFLKTISIFYLVSLCFGGGIYALTMYTDIGSALCAVASGGFVYFNISTPVLIGGIVMAYTIILLFKKSCIRNFSRDMLLIPMEISISGKIIKITALLDTGCELTAPITGEGVVLISSSAVSDYNIPVDFHLPIHTANGNSFAKAFFPDDIRCLSKDYQLAETPLIAVVSQDFSKDCLYTAVLNPKIIQEIHINGGTKNEKNKKLFAQPDIFSYRKNKTFFKEKHTLHRRERHTSSTTYSSGRSSSASAVRHTGAMSVSTSDIDRTKPSSGSIYCEKI